MVGLDIAVVIPKTDNQDLTDLIDLKVKWVNKKKEKVERCWQSKINLAQVTTTGGTLLSPVMSTHHSLSSFIAFTGNISDASTGGTLLSPVASDGPLSIVSGCFWSLVASSDIFSAISGCFLSFVADDSLLSTVSSHLLSLIVGGSPLSTVSGHLLSFVAGGSLLSAVFGSGPSSSILLVSS